MSFFGNEDVKVIPSQVVLSGRVPTEDDKYSALTLWIVGTDKQFRYFIRGMVDTNEVWLELCKQKRTS